MMSGSDVASTAAMAAALYRTPSQAMRPFRMRRVTSGTTTISAKNGKKTALSGWIRGCTARDIATPSPVRTGKEWSERVMGCLDSRHSCPRRRFSLSRLSSSRSELLTSREAVEHNGLPHARQTAESRSRKRSSYFGMGCRGTLRRFGKRGALSGKRERFPGECGRLVGKHELNAGTISQALWTSSPTLENLHEAWEHALGRMEHWERA